MAVFCDSQFDVTVFEHALRAAHEHDASIVLLDVRHRHTAFHLQKLLSSQGILGRRTVERLKQTVADQRDEMIRRMLGEMKLRAESEGLGVDIREAQGDFYEAVARVTAETEASLVVIQKDHHEQLRGDFEVMRV